MVQQARVIKRPDAAAVPLAPESAQFDRARVLRRAFVEASERAEQITARAERHARQLVRDAEEAAAAARRVAIEEGRASGYAEALARLDVIDRLEAESDRRALERSIEMARLLAERLIGRELASDPSAVVDLASQVLSEVRGAHQITLHVHPDDAAALSEHFDQSQTGVAVVSDATCARGDFRVVTDVGSIDAELGDRLDLLAAKLAHALRKGA